MTVPPADQPPAEPPVDKPPAEPPVEEPAEEPAEERDPRVDASLDYGGGIDDFGALGDPLTDSVEKSSPAPEREDEPAAEPQRDEEPVPVEDETILMDGRALRSMLAEPPPPVPAPDPAPPQPPPAPPPPAPPANGTATGDQAPVVLPAVRRPAAGTPPPPEELPEPEPAEGPAPAGFAGLVSALRVRRGRATQLVIAVLCGLLGFFAVVQLRLQADDSTFTTARQSDLIRILDDLSDRSERLDSELRDLEDRRNELQFGSDRSQAALTEAQERRDVLGILAGTVPARGPGIVLRITDPQRKVNAAVLLDALQELRDAGAEAVQINDVRVVAGTDFLDAEPGSVRIDGTVVAAPYTFKVIGDPDTLGPALRIPGGVFAVLDERGAAPSVDPRSTVTVDAVRPLQDPENAQATDPER